MIIKENKKNLHTYSEKEKYANDKQWFKDFIDVIEKSSSMLSDDIFVDDSKHRLKILYDLYNDKIDKEDFIEYCKTSGYLYEFPENFINENIITEKAKVLEGLETSRPFNYRVIAVNPEATTRKEQVYFDKIRQFVIQQIMLEIRKQVENDKKQQLEGRNLSQEEVQKIQQEIQQEIEANTPDEVKRYMERKYQDPAEVLSSQLLEYMMKELNIKQKFEEGWKHSIISAKEIYRVFIERGEPRLEVVNPLYFDYDKSNSYKIQDSFWAVATFYYSLPEIAVKFPELKDKELDKLYNDYLVGNNAYEFTFSDYEYYKDKIPATHYVWKTLRKVGFLTYINIETGELLETIVDENYKLNPNAGDIEVNFEWIYEVYEGWKIGNDTYAGMRRIPYLRDLDNINKVYLPYIGIVVDNVNSDSISLFARMKPYQYFYNIVTNKIRELMASDKGKLLLMNIGMIPRSQNIDTQKWLHYANMLHIGFFNPEEEGNKINDVNAMARVLDLSLMSDIQRYIQVADYIERRCGETVGINKQVEGRIGPNEAVGNTQQSIVQSSYILEPYFVLHNIVKRDVLEYLLDIARLAYSHSSKKKISFATDDLSAKILELDEELLTNNVMSIFISNTAKPEEIKDNIINLAHAALQNQRIEFSDVVKMLKTNNIEELTEMLEVAEQENMKKMQEIAQSNSQIEEQKSQQEHQRKLEEIDREGFWDLEKEKIKADASIKRQAILSVGFNEDKDVNDNGKLDVLEIAQQGIEADIKVRKQKLEEEKFKHQKEVDKKKLELEEKKLKNKKS